MMVLCPDVEALAIILDCLHYFHCYSKYKLRELHLLSAPSNWINPRHLST
jgi:hypothetical protein